MTGSWVVARGALRQFPAMTTFLRLVLLAVLLIAPPARADEVQAMKTALSVAATGDWDGALAVAPQGVGRDVVVWQWLRAGKGRLGDYEAFLQRRSDWPGLPLLKEKGEHALASETPARVVAYFGADSPVTGEGAVALVGALWATGDLARAETEAMRAWAELDLTPEQEQMLLGLAPDALARLHQARLDNLLWAGKGPQAERMLPLVSEGWRKLASARLALRAGKPGVDTLIAAVPEDLKQNPGLTYERFLWRMRRDQYDDAAALIIATPPEALGRPAMWAERRALLARWLLRQDRPADAYKVASQHGLTGGAAYADLEFLAGFVALRRLGDGETALRHFGHLGAEVTTPISLARAAYWQGRALEALGRDEDAETAMQAAARHQTAYYGLLASEKLGLPLDKRLIEDAPGPPGSWRQSAFAGSSVLAAGRLLLAAGDRTLGKRFLLHLGESLDDAELAQLADMALEMNEPHVAVVIAKAAAERGVILPRAYFPMPEFVPDGLKVSRALALAISRRESEFDPAARSHADARGLMQILPGTAKLMAKELGVEFTPGKLLTDPAYNVTLGSAYLAHLIEEFGPSIALVASGYNAGPGRPRRWVDDLGDPRQKSVDVVDWVETIPFAETRTYVMRVVEGVVIYRAKLKGKAGPVRLTPELRG